MIGAERARWVERVSMQSSEIITRDLGGLGTASIVQLVLVKGMLMSAHDPSMSVMAIRHLLGRIRYARLNADCAV